MTIWIRRMSISRSAQLFSLCRGHEVVVKHSGADYLGPEVSEKRVMYLESIFSVMTSVLTQAVSFLYTMVVLPGVYLASLIAVTAAASRILGGSRVRLI